MCGFGSGAVCEVKGGVVEGGVAECCSCEAVASSSSLAAGHSPSLSRSHYLGDFGRLYLGLEGDTCNRGGTPGVRSVDSIPHSPGSIVHSTLSTSSVVGRWTACGGGIGLTGSSEVLSWSTGALSSTVLLIVSVY